MYRSFGADDYKAHFKLPNNYVIDGILAAGTSYRSREMEYMKVALDRLKLKASFSEVPTKSDNYEFFTPVSEVNIGNRKLWYFCAYGGALLSEFLHFGYLFGANKTVLVGSCGGLKKGAKVGDIIVPTAASADGSTAYMYDREHKELQPSDEELSARLAKECIKKGLNVHRNKTVTSQAMIAETWEDVQEWSKDGYIGVEMEASTVFAVSNHFNKPSGALLLISDNLIEEETNLHSNFEDAKDMRAATKELEYGIALKELLRNDYGF